MLKRLVVLACCLPALSWAGDDKMEAGKAVFESYCGACHTLMLPKSQRLDRNNWAWVVDDMVNQMGCDIDEEQQQLVIDYLAENFGPDVPR